jgi:membrane protein implicated in regulation of membrane protease activity
MGWYLRKSFGFGPLRVNLSKSGVGYSLGVRGARIGATSRGTYIRMGRGGIYYQKYLQTKSSGPRTEPVPVPVPQLGSEPELAQVIQTASASSLQDSSATELLQEITLHHRKAKIAPVVMVVAGLALGVAMMASLPIWADAAIVLVGAVVSAIATRADYRRKVVHLDYALKPEAARAYVALLKGIEQLRALGGLWRISSEEVNADTKYHAGARYSVKRKGIAIKFEPPGYISTDAAVYMVNTGPQRLYFLPDRILVYEGDQIGAVQYSSLTFNVAPSTFVESDSVPYDTEIIGRTWRYTNKSGGPDRRFASNPEIPLVRYAEITLQSAGGLNYLIQASNMQKANSFTQAVRQYGAHLSLVGQTAVSN